MTIVIGGAPGPEVHLLPLGGTVDRVLVTGGDGVRRDVALRLGSAAERAVSPDYVGATVGRYANRIAAGRFPLDGREITVGTHDRGQSLHGGPDGFDRRVWEVVDHGPDRALLRLVSPDGDQGFPGEVVALARYAVEGDTIRLDLTARTTAPTVVSLTSHVYWNLDGTAASEPPSIDDQRLSVAAERYTPVDDVGIPTGGHEPVDGTGFDLRSPRLLRDAGAIDHSFVLDGAGPRPVARLDSAATGTRLTLGTDAPALQVYTGDGLADPLTPRAGVALEPHHAPDSPNHQGEPGWPSPVVRAGERFTRTIVWSFGPLVQDRVVQDRVD